VLPHTLLFFPPLTPVSAPIWGRITNKLNQSKDPLTPFLGLILGLDMSVETVFSQTNPRMGYEGQRLKLWK
jgi:hypothetical protein